MPPPPPIFTEWCTTGHYRARVTWYGLVILELQEERFSYRYPLLSGYQPASKVRETRWRRVRRRDIARNVEVVLR